MNRTIIFTRGTITIQGVNHLKKQYAFFITYSYYNIFSNDPDTYKVFKGNDKQLKKTTIQEYIQSKSIIGGIYDTYNPVLIAKRRKRKIKSK